MAENRNKQQPRDRGDPRRGYGNTDEMNEKRIRDQNEKPQRQLPDEQDDNPDRRRPEHAER